MKTRHINALAIAAAAAVFLTCGEARAAQDLQSRIQSAIKRGRNALMPILREAVDSPRNDYPMGRIALPLAAVLKAGASPEDDTVQRAIRKLAAMPPKKVYSVACYLFALDAYWQGRYRASRRLLRRGRTEVKPLSLIPPRGPTRDRMEELVKWLIRGEGGAWNYTRRGGADLSNSQFAVLGLEVGLDNGIEIPAGVFQSIVRHLLTSHSPTGPTGQLAVLRRTAEWPGVTPGRHYHVRYYGKAGGWNYRSHADRPPTYTMTPAGVSSLMIARRALMKMGMYSREVKANVEQRIGAGLLWIRQNKGRYFANHHGKVYYALYSLEKVGDIGQIVKLGDFDWYTEGARFLIQLQGEDGLWKGSWGHDASTSFALLFLTRATRSRLQTLGPPVVKTPGKDGKPVEETDLVYIPQLKGFLSASTLFSFLAETRDPRVLHIAGAAVEAFPPHRTHEVLEYLLRLWGSRRDPLTRFARETVAELLGVEGDREFYHDQLRILTRVRRLEKNPEDAREREVARLLSEAAGPAAKRRVMDLIDRHAFVGAVPAVIEALVERDLAVRERAQALLQQLTQAKVAPPRDKASAREVREHAARWRAWWDANGARLAGAREAREIAGRLLSAGGAKEAQPWIQRLVELGQPAVPALVDALERPAFSIYVVVALEKITGESRGTRAEDWREVARR